MASPTPARLSSDLLVRKTDVPQDAKPPEPPRQERRVMSTFRMKEVHKERLKQAVANERRTMQTILDDILEEGLAKRGV